jgi:hypothetical protein
VTIKMGGPQVNGMQLLLGGEADMLMGYDIQVLKAIEKGLGVVTVAASFQKDLQGLMTHDDVGSLADLKSKTILVASSRRTTWWPWLKRKFAYTDEQTQPYTFNLQPFFADNNVAQQGYPSSEPFQALQKGVAVKFFLFADAGYPPYGTTLERFSLDVSRDSYRGFPGARKSDSASSDGNGGAGDGEGILEGSAHTGSLDRGDRRERTRGGASARRQRLDCDPLDRSLDDDRQRRSQARDRPHPLAS